MHAAKLEKSLRLQRVLGVLRGFGGKGVTSWTLMQTAQVVAPATCVSELRKQGHQINCKREGAHWRYTLSEVVGERLGPYSVDSSEKAT